MATIHDALILMGENRVSALPVVNVNGDHACVGILSTDDLDRVDSTGRRFLLEKLARNMGNEPVRRS